MNALDLLEKDHRLVKDLLEELTAAETAEARGELFERIRAEMETHEAIEEQLFYPALKKHAEAREIVLEGYEEHHVVDHIIHELEELDYSDESWSAKVKVMKENVEHHIAEEEGEMFAKARTLLSSEDLDELGLEMELKKGELNKLLTS